MKFFMPDWEDKVDPEFNFQNDKPAKGRDTARDVYAHEIFPLRPYDGVLISRAVVEKSKTNYQALQKKGAHAYLRLPPGFQVFGDCGAWSYVNETEPWYDTRDVLDYYAEIGVDYGASVDHLVVTSIYETQTVEEVMPDGSVVTKEHERKIVMPEDERKRRIQLSLDNADEFLNLHRKCGYSFVPVGVAQGWDPTTYAQSVSALLKMGYTYIALGGLARSPAEGILQVLQSVRETIDSITTCSSDVQIHLFGVAKLSLLSAMKKYQVSSIDSASYLRKAWLRSGQNYLGADGKWYAAVRVPQSYNYKVREYIATNGKSLTEVEAQERRCLETLEIYDREGLSANEFNEMLDQIVEYDTYLLRAGDDGQSLRDAKISSETYRRTLEAKPWKECSCEICRALGVHVLIFRGTNRNKRRGFHNTWTFCQRLKAH